MTGTAEDVETLQGYLEQDSFLGGGRIEGIVVKNYSAFGERDGKMIMTKLVSEDFRELNKADFRARNPQGKDVANTIGNALASEGRFLKAVQTMRDNGELTGEPKDIGPLLKWLQQDLEEEKAEEVKELLWKGYRKTIQACATRGFAEWYKARLVEEMIDDNGKV